MADDKEKAVKQLDFELDKLNAKLTSISANIEAGIRAQLSSAGTEISSLIGKFEKGENVAKKAAAEIQKQLIRNNKLATDKVALEEKLRKAIQLGQIAEEARINQSKFDIDLKEDIID